MLLHLEKCQIGWSIAGHRRPALKQHFWFAGFLLLYLYIRVEKGVDFVKGKDLTIFTTAECFFSGVFTSDYGLLGPFMVTFLPEPVAFSINSAKLFSVYQFIFAYWDPKFQMKYKYFCTENGCIITWCKPLADQIMYTKFPEMNIQTQPP